MIPLLLPPKNENELLARAQAIAGLTLAQLAEQCNQSIPQQTRFAKGWAGQLLELALGATAANLAEPDFQALGIELKTIPVNRQGKPLESTYVCSVALLERTHWEQSLVKKKLAKVLWIPILAEVLITLDNRIIGYPLLWTMPEQDEAILRCDWEEITDLINQGYLREITAHHGKYLQLRPKAANARQLTWALNDEGIKVQTLPRGFYLRTKFTARILHSLIN